MITGDNESTAKSIAKELGIDDVQANATPGAKLHAIEKLTERPLVFVGDGVNDAPVLTAADVGVALGARGSTAASESADIVIMQDNISHVAMAVSIARRTFGIAKQSILIGILLSLILMGIFFTGKFSPLLGAVLQEVVDVFVIFNALRAHTSKEEAF
jgi:P-type E1-E2 ATPase